MKDEKQRGKKRRREASESPSLPTVYDRMGNGSKNDMIVISKKRKKKKETKKEKRKRESSWTEGSLPTSSVERMTKKQEVIPIKESRGMEHSSDISSGGFRRDTGLPPISRIKLEIPFKPGNSKCFMVAINKSWNKVAQIHEYIRRHFKLVGSITTSVDGCIVDKSQPSSIFRETDTIEVDVVPPDVSPSPDYYASRGDDDIHSVAPRPSSPETSSCPVPCAEMNPGNSSSKPWPLPSSSSPFSSSRSSMPPVPLEERASQDRLAFPRGEELPDLRHLFQRDLVARRVQLEKP